MERKETINLMNRIKSHYQEFIIDEFKIREWHRELEKYSYEDVSKKLDEHLSSEVYGEYIPKLHFLTKRLVAEKDKGKIVRYQVICQLCEKEVWDVEYDKHYARCSAAQTIVKDFDKYVNLEVKYEKLMTLSDEKFEEVYKIYLDKMMDADIPQFRKKAIARCLYPDMEIDINEFIGGMKNGM